MKLLEINLCGEQTNAIRIINVFFLKKTSLLNVKKNGMLCYSITFVAFIKMRRLLIIFVFILSSGAAFAQKSVEGGLQLSAMSYFGDVENYDYLQSVTPGAGVFIRWNFNTRLTLRGEFIYGWLKAEGVLTDAYIAQFGTGNTEFPRDLSQRYNFNKSFQSFGILFEYNFLEYKLGSKIAKFTPYLTVGGGLFYSRSGNDGTFILEPEVVNVIGGVNHYLPYEAEPGFRTDQVDTFSPVIPFGMGIKWNLSDKLALNIEGLLRKTFTDNIDNLVDPKRFKNVDAAGDVEPGESAYDNIFANSDIHNNDWFSSISLSISYLLWNGKKKCAVYE